MSDKIFISGKELADLFEKLSNNSLLNINNDAIFITDKCMKIVYEQNFTGGKTMDINEMKSLRYNFLKKLYEVSNASEHAIFNKYDIGKDLIMNEPTTMNICNYLVGEGLIKKQSLAGLISITHLGIKEIEFALSNPDKQTTYFPPANNIKIINIHNMTNSQIQQDSVNSTQNLTISYSKNDIDKIKSLLTEIENIIPQLDIAKEVKESIINEKETIKAILSTPKPKMNFLKESLNVLYNLFIGITANTLTNPIVQGLSALLA